MPQTSSNNLSTMSAQQPIVVASRSPSPAPSSVPSDIEHRFRIRPEDFKWSGELQQHVDLWRGDTNPRPTSIEVRSFMRNVGMLFQHFAYFEEGMGGVLQRVCPWLFMEVVGVDNLVSNPIVSKISMIRFARRSPNQLLTWSERTLIFVERWTECAFR